MSVRAVTDSKPCPYCAEPIYRSRSMSLTRFAAITGHKACVNKTQGLARRKIPKPKRQRRGAGWKTPPAKPATALVIVPDGQPVCPPRQHHWLVEAPVDGWQEARCLACGARTRMPMPEW